MKKLQYYKNITIAALTAVHYAGFVVEGIPQSKVILATAGAFLLVLIVMQWCDTKIYESMKRKKVRG